MKNTPESLYSVASKLAIPLTAYFIGLFFLMNLVYEKNQYSLILLVLVLMVPVLIYKYAKKYRDMFAGGVLELYECVALQCDSFYLFQPVIFFFHLHLYDLSEYRIRILDDANLHTVFGAISKTINQRE